MASTVVKQLLTEEDELFFVPNDIIVDILKRLPVKSLLRFRCAFAVTDQAMYYFAYKENGDQFDSTSLVSFDMGREVFTELWIMEEEATSGGSEQGWKKEFISSACSPELYPLAIWRDKAVFIGQKPKIPGANREFFLYLLNLTTRKVKEVLISPEHAHLFNALIYAESLVSIGN
ncbi:hypothetical protein K1719_001752 [Acacia pycnantha]|nr:hypothetical protein K1719_001752 [Acacia pycnantha]